MRVMILGGDGYLGWPTAMYLSNKGYEVAVVDNMIKRFWEAELGVQPLLPIRPMHRRVARWEELTGRKIASYVCDIAKNHRNIYRIFDEFRPDAVVHYAEQPSAPFSMIDREKCVLTQQNNIVGTLNVLFAMRHTNPDAHMVKLGTMGEYGTPNIDIEEGWLEVEHNGRRDRVLYPKKPGSFYHLSKVHDSANLEFACRIWGARVTDLNQGVVYGMETDETRIHPDFATSIHYDDVFGTVLNRFVVQAACDQPLTVYGKGGQTRGYLNIRDTLRCVELAVSNPAEAGEFRVFNQFTEQFSVNQLAAKVAAAGKQLGIEVALSHIENPRVEMEEHYYSARNSALLALGLEPHQLTEDVVAGMIDQAVRNRDEIDTSHLTPKVHWKNK